MTETPAPPPLAPKPPERHEIPFGQAMLEVTAFVITSYLMSLWVFGQVGANGALLVGQFISLRKRGLLRSQQIVMAEVAWLVIAVILKLAFLQTLPAEPLVVLVAFLLVQYVAQLAVDLKAFGADSAENDAPPVTYAVTFAVAPLLALGAELFRAARTNYSQVLGVFLATLLAAAVFLLFVVWWDWTKKAFSSLKMAVTLLSLIGLGSVVGTFVIQRAPEETVAKHYDKFMNGEGAAPVNARYLFQDPKIDWPESDEARRVAMNEKFGKGQGDRWAEMVKHERVKKAKEAEGAEFVRHNRAALHSFYEFCEDTQLTRIFKSWYFNSLLVLLAFTVCGVMARRWPYDLRDVGWVVTHTGIVFLLVCLAGSDLTVRDGFIELAPTAEPGGSGLPSETRSFDDIFQNRASQDPNAHSRDFNWTLRLVRTSADWYQQLEVTFVDQNGRGVASEQYPVSAGKVVELDRPSKDAPPRYKIEMLEALERCRPSLKGWRAGKSSGIAALPLSISDEGQKGEAWITDDGAPLPLPGRLLRFVSARTAEDEKRWESPTIPADVGAIGFVRVAAGETEFVKLPATVGANAAFEHDGKRWRVAVVDVALDMEKVHSERDQKTKTPLDRQIPAIAEAALSFETEGVAAPLRAVALAGRYDALGNGDLGNATLKAAGIQSHLDLVVPEEIRVVHRADGTSVVVVESRGKVEPPRALHAGDALPLPADGGATITAGAVVENAEEEIEAAPIPEETDAEYMKNGLAGINEQEGVPALKVRITEEGEAPREAWLVGSDPWGEPSILSTKDGRVKLVLGNGIESMYRSAVQAIDSKGKVLGEHVVRVNAPFRMDGYEFYQNNFARPDQGGPLSTFRVKYDPFVSLIYVGFALVAGGVIVMLWFPGQRAFKLHAHLARLPEEGPRT